MNTRVSQTYVEDSHDEHHAEEELIHEAINSTTLDIMQGVEDSVIDSQNSNDATPDT